MAIVKAADRFPSLFLLSDSLLVRRLTHPLHTSIDTGILASFYPERSGLFYALSHLLHEKSTAQAVQAE